MNLKGITSFVLGMVLPISSFAQVPPQIALDLKSTPYQTSKLTPEQNAAIFGKYCIGDPNSTELPKPNYENALVKAAASKLSLTKQTGDKVLYSSASKQFARSLESIRENLETARNDENSELINQIIAELAKASVEAGIPASATTLFNTLKEMSIKKLTDKLAPLQKTLKSELNEVNQEKTLQVAKELEVELNKVNEPVNLARLISISQDLSKTLNAEVKPFDRSGTQTALSELDAIIKTMPDEISWLSEMLNGIVMALEGDDGSGSESSIPYDLNYALSNLHDESMKKYIVPGSEIANKVSFLTTQLLALQVSRYDASVESFKKQVDSLNGAPKASELSELEYGARDLVETLGTVTSVFSMSAEAFYNSIKIETGKFGSNQLLASLSTHIVDLQTLTSSDGNSGAPQMGIVNSGPVFKPMPPPPKLKKNPLQGLQGLIPSLRENALFKTKAIEAVLAKLESELVHLNSSRVNEAVNNLANNLANNPAGNDETDGLIYTASYQIQAVKGLSDEAMKQVNEFADMTKSVNVIQSAHQSLSSPLDIPSKSQHFYFYSSIAKIYKVRDLKPELGPKGVEPEAHAFITQLCGEYRDRASLIEAKLKWANNIFILEGNSKSGFEIDMKKNVWSQIPASAYRPYLSVSAQVWEAKRENNERYISIGSEKDIDNPVDGFTVCETGYIFSEYVGKNRDLGDFKEYLAGLETFKEKCSADDQRDYYDFRGDSNFKHYSPEANGMIWYATTMGTACKSPTEVKPNQNGITSEDCKKYFSKPFFYRYNAARAGLATWLFRSDEHAEKFASQGEMVAVYPHRYPELAPFSFSFDHTQNTGDIFGFDSRWISLQGAWNLVDIGFNLLTGIGSSSPDMLSAFVRLRDAVDRHTDWYHSGYNDKNGAQKEQAYSPFVASSYSMSESDGFTSCGTTVQCPDDGLKRWMFVFRVKPENWYTPARILKNEPVDFDRMWIDETSFGRSNLADGEKAWDRLGTPSEEEFDSVLYLVNINNVDDDGHD